MTRSLRSVIPGSTRDQDVIAAFRAQGPGWQSRINEALREAAGVQLGNVGPPPKQILNALVFTLKLLLDKPPVEMRVGKRAEEAPRLDV